MAAVVVATLLKLVYVNEVMEPLLSSASSRLPRVS
jgi:hypothetical protein